MWGRLDGAKQILQTLLPPGAQRQRLINEAHKAIIREELVTDDAGPLTDLLGGSIADDEGASLALLAELESNPAEGRAAFLAALGQVPEDDLLEYFRAHYDVPRQLDPQRTVSLAGRGATIGRAMLDDISKARQVPSHPGFWLSRFGRVAWGLAEVALPGRRPAGLATLLFRHWTAGRLTPGGRPHPRRSARRRSGPARGLDPARRDAGRTDRRLDRRSAHDPRAYGSNDRCPRLDHMGCARRRSPRPARCRTRRHRHGV